jgi:hypothetical protein
MRTPSSSITLRSTARLAAARRLPGAMPAAAPGRHQQQGSSPRAMPAGVVRRILRRHSTRARHNARMSDKTMLLVDGSSYLYRAYHAMPDLRSPDGFPTGAIHGMVAMMKWLRERLPGRTRGLRLRRQGPDLPRRLVPRVQGPARAHARPAAPADRAHPRGGAPAGLAGAGSARHRGRRRHRHAGPRGRGQRPPGGDLHRRQGPGAAGHARRSR